MITNQAGIGMGFFDQTTEESCQCPELKPGLLEKTAYFIHRLLGLGEAKEAENLRSLAERRFASPSLGVEQTTQPGIANMAVLSWRRQSTNTAILPVVTFRHFLSTGSA